MCHAAKKQPPFVLLKLDGVMQEAPCLWTTTNACRTIRRLLVMKGPLALFQWKECPMSLVMLQGEEEKATPRMGPTWLQ